MAVTFLTNDDRSDLEGKLGAITPNSGSVGQVLKIAAVDENGAVAAVEASSRGPGAGTFVKSVAHRGYSLSAPENTLPAYKLARELGFLCGECDVNFTADGVAVLLHDDTIDRTSDGTGSVGSFRYGQLLDFDFGSWKGERYTGCRIPTFREFVLLCKKIGMHPYVEVKGGGEDPQTNLQGLVDTVRRCGMEGNVTWISFDATLLNHIKTADSMARLGYVANTIDASVIAAAQALMTGTNQVFLDAAWTAVTDDKAAMCMEGGLPLEVWTVNSEEQVVALDPYVSGITSDHVLTENVLYQDGLAAAAGAEADGYAAFRTISADALTVCQLGNTPPYLVENAYRLSYTAFDIPIKADYIYKFEFDSIFATTPALSIGLQYYPSQVLELVENGERIDQIKHDDGWLKHGVEKQFGIDGYVRITFGNGDYRFSVGDVGPIRISRKLA